MKNHLTLRPPRTLVLGIVAAMFATVLLALVAPSSASAAVPGYEVKPGRSDFNTLPSKGLRIDCPDGKRAIGFGVVLAGAPGDVVLTSASVHPSGVSFAATADQDGTTANWRIDGGAVCVNPLPGLEYRVAHGPTSPGDTHPATATCPQGKRLVGAGALVDGGNGQVSLNNLQLGDTSVTVTGAEDQDGFNRPRSLFATAVCANPLPGLRIVPGRGTNFDSQALKHDSASCANNERALSAGWGLGGDGQTLFTSVAIGAFGANFGASEDDDGFAGNWSFGGHIICATS